MPEVVECKVIADQLNSYLTGSEILAIEIIGGRFIKSPPVIGPLPAQVKNVGVKGKFIYFVLENNWCIFNTLGMTGSWGKVQETHSALRIDVRDKDSLYFTDPRRFGTFKFVYRGLQEKLDSLGFDILQESDYSKFRSSLGRANKTLAEDLMNQKWVCGIGNYLKAEILYEAKLSPWRNTKSLSETEWKELYTACKVVVDKSWRYGGATLSTYKNFEGKVGGYKDFLKVYRKERDPLGNLIKVQDTLDKRTTYWVPEIQK